MDVPDASGMSIVALNGKRKVPKKGKSQGTRVRFRRSLHIEFMAGRC